MKIATARTAWALTFQVGEQQFNVGRDVAAPDGGSNYPETLATIESPELRAFLAEWDRTPHTLIGSAATDWRKIGDRINFIVDLFRTRLNDPDLWRAPYDAAEQARILGTGPTTVVDSQHSSPSAPDVPRRGGSG